MFGPYVPTERQGDGNVVVNEQHPGARRRAIYLQQRRSQVEAFLEVFDTPSVLTTCPQRATSNVPLQSLALLNSDWIRFRAVAFSQQVCDASKDDDGRIALAFRAIGSGASDEIRLAARSFLMSQRTIRGENGEAEVWADFCQMLLASNLNSHLE